MKNLQVSKWSMIITIAIICIFQGYWLHKLYDDEWDSLKKRTDVLLKETVQELQTERIRTSPYLLKPTSVSKVEVYNDGPKIYHYPPPGISAKRKMNGVMVFSGAGTRDNGAMIVRKDSFARHFRRRVEPGQLMDSLMDAYRGKGLIRIFMTDSGRSKPGLGAKRVQIHQPDDFLPGMEMASAGHRKQRVTMSGDTLVKYDLKDRKVADSSYRRVVFEWSAMTDSIPLKKVDSAYRIALHKEGIKLPWRLHLKRFNDRHDRSIDSVPEDELVTRSALIGFDKPFGYQARFENPFTYILGKLTFPIIVAFALIAITVVSFATMYRNLLFQRKLGAIKNEFISNMTHELKTPIATVSVAIEALKNFNAIHDPARTKEYLDISASELQRLSLLVDKVLKLSMFENKEVDVRKEKFDMRTLLEEVTATMRLQFEKANARVNISSQGSAFMLYADKMHITSVIYNLLDNALKYSPLKPVIDINLRSADGQLIFSVSDNGVGIPGEYKDKVFEKFFRVPSNDHHNIKGYGLGLSYVSQVIEKHGGTVTVESGADKGSTFIIKLPVES